MCVEEAQLAGRGSTYHAGPGTRAQVVRAGGKCLHSGAIPPVSFSFSLLLLLFSILRQGLTL